MIWTLSRSGIKKRKKARSNFTNAGPTKPVRKADVYWRSLPNWPGVITFPTFGAPFLSAIPFSLALPQILAEDYSVKEWNDAVGYILGTRTSFSSAREAYGFLLHALAESACPDATS